MIHVRVFTCSFILHHGIPCRGAEKRHLAVGAVVEELVQPVNGVLRPAILLKSPIH